MFEVLAIVPVVTMALFVIAIIVLIILLIPVLKKSKGVDKLADGLFKPVEDNTIDDCIDKIKDGKEGLIEQGKEVAQAIKDKTDEQTKIQKNL